jgi:hypothetical protein
MPTVRVRVSPRNSERRQERAKTLVKPTRSRYSGKVAKERPVSHSPATPIDADLLVPPFGSWVRELIQQRVDDVVLAAACCKPNAPGPGELAGFAALGARQMLKARGTFLAERVALGATPLHVHAFALFFGRRIARPVACWPRGDVYTTPIRALGGTPDPDWPALLLTDASGKPRAELQILERDADAHELLVLLTDRRLPLSR